MLRNQKSKTKVMIDIEEIISSNLLIPKNVKEITNKQERHFLIGLGTQNKLLTN